MHLPFRATRAADPQQRAFYRTFARFEAFLKGNAMKLGYTLQESDCVIFANCHIIHGWRAFDVVSSHRHLRGTYVGLDAFQDRYLATFA